MLEARFLSDKRAEPTQAEHTCFVESAATESIKRSCLSNLVKPFNPEWQVRPFVATHGMTVVCIGKRTECNARSRAYLHEVGESLRLSCFVPPFLLRFSIPILGFDLVRERWKQLRGQL